MSRCYLDTNFLYLHLRSPSARASETFENWRRRAIGELGPDNGVISALVLDELAYRLILAWLRDDGEADPLSAYRADTPRAMRSIRKRLTGTWEAIERLSLELQQTDQSVVDRAKSAMARQNLSPRDAFHAAHALAAHCTVIVSSDDAFDRIRPLERLAP